MKNPVTTHVLDTSTGRPAVGVPVRLECLNGQQWEEIGRGTTNDDGRVPDLVTGNIDPGIYRMSFDTAAYFGNLEHYYPIVRVEFRYKGDGRHHHVPLLISPFGYSTYRGS